MSEVVGVLVEEHQLSAVTVDVTDGSTRARDHLSTSDLSDFLLDLSLSSTWVIGLGQDVIQSQAIRSRVKLPRRACREHFNKTLVGQYEMWYRYHFAEQEYYILMVAARQSLLNVIFESLKRRRAMYRSIEPGICALMRLLPTHPLLQAIVWGQDSEWILYVFKNNEWIYSIPVSHPALLDAVWVSRAFFEKYRNDELWERYPVRFLEDVIFLEESSFSEMMAYALALDFQNDVRDAPH